MEQVAQRVLIATSDTEKILLDGYRRRLAQEGRPDILGSFVRHGIQGMSLARIPGLRPLQHRCACGKPISENKMQCMPCHKQQFPQEYSNG